MRLLALLLVIAVGVVGYSSTAASGAPGQPQAQIVTQLGHWKFVVAVAFSPDGKLALSGSNDKTMRLWDVQSGRELRNFMGHGPVYCVAFSPNGRFALSGSYALRLWDVETGRELRSFAGHRGGVHSAAFSPDGRLALSGSGDNTLKLWEVASGRELRSFTGHTGRVNSVAFFPDGKLVLSGSEDKTLKVWEVATGREFMSLSGHAGEVLAVAISGDGKLALSGGGRFSSDPGNGEAGELKLWDVHSGRMLKSLVGHNDIVESAAFSPDGKLAFTGSYDGTLKLWDLASGRELRNFASNESLTGDTNPVYSVAFSPDGKTALSGNFDHTAKLWDVTSGRELKSFRGSQSAVFSVALSPDGRSVLSGGDHKTSILWDLASGRELRSFAGHKDTVHSVAVSHDGKLALSGSTDHTLKLWELNSGGELKSFTGHTDAVYTVAFSPDDKLALSGGRDSSLRLWDVASGRELRSSTGFSARVELAAFSPDGTAVLLNGATLLAVTDGQALRRFTPGSGFNLLGALSPDGKTALSVTMDKGRFRKGLDFRMDLWEAASGRRLGSFGSSPDDIRALAFSPDGRLALWGGDNNALQLWDVETGSEVRRFTGHVGAVLSIAFSPDGKRSVSSSADGTVRLWNLQSGEEIVAMMASRDGNQLAITPQGFFTASQRDTDMLAIVRGVEVTTVGQVHQSLFNPDLVREALAGDPDGEVKRAAEVTNLDKVLDAGPPPTVAIISHELGSRSGKDLVTVAARVIDRGKGIGRVEWRINGVTAGVMGVPAGPGPDYEVTQDLALDSEENRIEVIAYEHRNLLASLPAQTTIVYDGPADTVKPKLHILAIGINAYEDKGWAEPGSNEVKAFPPLGLAVGDATAFAAEMEKAAAGLYGEVRVRTALDREASPANLDRIVREMAAEISPRDTFVLYVAGHGYSLNGNYYMIPQDYQGGIDPVALKARAIGQDRLQDWIANRIKAKKALILLDTCEFGALTGGYTKSRVDAPASEAAVGRLHEATGRPVLTAAAAGKPAFEGYKGHGVFTYALMEALHKGDTNNNGKIELTELAAHVQRRVPELVAELGEGGGTVKGAAVVAMRGAEGDKQSAHFGSTGEDFAVVARLP